MSECTPGEEAEDGGLLLLGRVEVQVRLLVDALVVTAAAAATAPAKEKFSLLQWDQLLHREGGARAALTSARAVSSACPLQHLLCCSSDST